MSTSEGRGLHIHWWTSHQCHPVNPFIGAGGPSQGHDDSCGLPRVGLLAATGHAEDHQVVAHLAARLARLGVATVRAHPGQVAWRDGLAHLDAGDGRGLAPVGALVRFYQAEWLAGLPASCEWPAFFRGGLTPVVNPGTAIVVESKRFPLAWDAIDVPLPTWRALLPATRSPRPGLGHGWLLKPALGNTGEGVTIPGLASPRDRRRAAIDAAIRPRRWAAQRRFEALPLATPIGPRYPCLGVFVVDGEAAGIYGRLAARPLVDFAATDVAVLRAEG